MKKKIKEEVTALKRKMIIQEAESYIDRYGYKNFKISDFAKSCGISVGALYQLFDSKEELFYQYTLLQIEKFYNDLKDRCKTTSDPKERLLIYVKMKLEIFKKKSSVVQEHLVYDPLFVLKLGKQNPTINIVENFLAKEFEKLSNIHTLKDTNYIRVAYAFGSYILGYIEYYLSIKYQEECNLNKMAQNILDSFLYGQIQI